MVHNLGHFIVPRFIVRHFVVGSDLLHYVLSPTIHCVAKLSWDKYIIAHKYYTVNIVDKYRVTTFYHTALYREMISLLRYIAHIVINGL